MEIPVLFIVVALQSSVAIVPWAGMMNKPDGGRVRDGLAAIGMPKWG
jgi:hypothetical protein